MPTGVKASAALFFASVITSGIAYIVTPIYTRLLNPDVYGQTSVFMTWLQIFGIIAMFCLSNGVFNNGMIDYPDRRDEYSFSMLIFSNIITLVFSGLILSLYPLLKQILGIDFPLMILMCIIFIFQPAYTFWTKRQRYELKYKYTFIWTIVSAFASPVVAVICILTAKEENKLYARLLGAELTLIAIYICFYFYLAYKSRGKINTKYWKEALLFNLPLIPHYLSMYILNSSDKLMISRLVSDSATAYYSVAYSVASLVMVLWSSVNASLVPYTYENCKKKNYKAISRVTTLLLTVFAAVCIFVIMLAPEVVEIMATADYKEAIYVIPAIIGGVFFQVQYYIYANIVYYYKKPKYVMVASVTAALLNLALNFIFIKQYGFLAAGYTTLFCYFVQATIDYFVMKKVFKEKIYNMRYIGVLSLVVIAISLLSDFIYDNAIARYAIIATIVVLCIVFQKKIIGLFKMMTKGEKN